jgi:hypothetical protein
VNHNGRNVSRAWINDRPEDARMTMESLTYAEIGERLGVSPEAARKKVRSLGIPAPLGNDGKARITIDLGDIRHSPRKARTPGVLRPDNAQTIPPGELNKMIDNLRAEIARKAEIVAERDEARLHVVKLASELTGARALQALLERQLEDMMGDRDAWRRQAEQLVAVHAPPEARPARQGLLRRLFG